jgi:hypothetical protein
MSLEDGLYTYLGANAGVSALVSTRIYPVVLPEGKALPALVFQRISSDRHYHLSGYSQLCYARMQITSLATTPEGARGLAEAVRNALDAYAGAMGSTTVQSCMMDNEVELPSEGSADHEPDFVFAVAQDYLISYTEAEPVR